LCCYDDTLAAGFHSQQNEPLFNTSPSSGAGANTENARIENVTGATVTDYLPSMRHDYEILTAYGT